MKTISDAPLPSEQIAERLRRNYRPFQYTFVNFLADHLADCSRAFGGDLQKLLVVAILGQVAINARMKAAGDAPPAAISAFRLAQATGIPRETVRRKLKSLEGAGWIERTPDGAWALRIVEGEAPARRDLADLDDRGIERVARLLASLREFLPQNGHPTD